MPVKWFLMRIHSSGHQRGNKQSVSLHFSGTDTEMIRLIDELERLAELADGKGSPALAEIARQLNFSTGSPINYEAPTGQIQI